MKYFAIAFALVSFTAQAHFELGTYKGQTAENQDCSVNFDGVTFTTPFHHPLAERITVTAFEKKFVLQHPTVVNDAGVLFDDSFLETTIPTETGAEFFRVTMDHSAGTEGPVSYLYVTHDWTSNKVSRFECLNLVFKD